MSASATQGGHNKTADNRQAREDTCRLIICASIGRLVNNVTCGHAMYFRFCGKLLCFHTTGIWWYEVYGKAYGRGMSVSGRQRTEGRS